MALENNINWVNNLEEFDETVVNRPLKELVAIIDSKDFDPLVNKLGLKINIAELQAGVQEGDLVYKNLSGFYDRAVGNDTNAKNVLGVYQLIDTIPTIIRSGVVEKTGLTVGTKYFLHPTILGEYTENEYYRATSVGIAISTTKLLVDIFVPSDFTKRLDKSFEELDVSSVLYDANDNVTEIVYNTGNKELWTRVANVVSKIDYTDIDGTTVKATNTFTYDGSNRLLTSVWTEV